MSGGGGVGGGGGGVEQFERKKVLPPPKTCLSAPEGKKYREKERNPDTGYLIKLFKKKSISAVKQHSRYLACYYTDTGYPKK